MVTAVIVIVAGCVWGFYSWLAPRQYDRKRPPEDDR
jgi:hypothetical protein